MSGSLEFTRAVSDAALDEAERPFCGDELDVTDYRSGEVHGYCHGCREVSVVAVPV